MRPRQSSCKPSCAEVVYPRYSYCFALTKPSPTSRALAMGNILSSSDKKKRKRKRGGISDADRAVLDLKNARDRLRRYQAKLDSESATLTQQARQLLRAGKRDRALLTIKFRRFREEKINEIDRQLLTVESMVNSIEWQEEQATVVASLRSGTDALNALNKAISVESVEALLEETREALEKEQEISALLAQAPVLSRDQEDEIDEELAQLEDAPNAAALALPIAPVAKINISATIDPNEEQQQPEESRRRVVAA